MITLPAPPGKGFYHRVRRKRSRDDDGRPAGSVRGPIQRTNFRIISDICSIVDTDIKEFGTESSKVTDGCAEKNDDAEAVSKELTMYRLIFDNLQPVHL